MFLSGEEDEEELSKEEETVEKPGIHETVPIKEEGFYKPFADWLVNEVEECTRAIPLGGNLFRDKWGTPDVIGKRESQPLAKPVRTNYSAINPT